jgi:hypothetical protein
MRTSTTLPTTTGVTLRRIALAAALAVVIGAIPMKPAFADNDRNDRDRHGDRRDRDRGHDRGRGHYRYHVYAPPPVYYPREESPGIRLFFPIEIH